MGLGTAITILFALVLAPTSALLGVVGALFALRFGRPRPHSILLAILAIVLNGGWLLGVFTLFAGRC